MELGEGIDPKEKSLGPNESIVCELPCNTGHVRVIQIEATHTLSEQTVEPGAEVVVEISFRAQATRFAAGAAAYGEGLEVVLELDPELDPPIRLNLPDALRDLADLFELITGVRGGR